MTVGQFPEILSIGHWATNAAMIADIAKLGYLDGTVLDATYGEGNFWTDWKPADLTTNDLHKPADFAWSYRAMPTPDDQFDAVVFDPPYRLSGRRDRGEMDARYGTTTATSREDVLADLALGAVECFRVARKYLLVKCQDQVEGGKRRWQTDIVTRAVEGVGGRKVDRFDLVTRLRPQPPGRRQLTSRGNYSTLLVFAKPKAKENQ